MTTVCPFAIWRPIGANYSTGGRQPLRGFVPHVQVGNGSLWGFFNTPKPPGQGASADFWCRKDGYLEQYVGLADQAWAQGSSQHNGNPTFSSCEFEGFPSEPMTPEQIATGGRLIGWLRSDVHDFPLQVNHDPDNGSGVTPHYVFGGGHTCPGPGPREGQFPDLIAAAQHLNPPGDDMKAQVLVMTDTDITVWITDGIWKRALIEDAERQELFDEGLITDVNPKRIPKARLDRYVIAH